MPFTLTRSILVIIIPGLVAITPWALLAINRFPRFESYYSTFSTIINISLVGVAIIIGSLIEGAMSHLEVKWDREQEDKFKVRDNWFDYLSQQCAMEPVGYRYISRLVTAMYFELSMTVASPIALTGLAALIFDLAYSWWNLAGIVLLVIAVLITWWFYWQAKCTHSVLCETRKELNERINNSR